MRRWLTTLAVLMLSVGSVRAQDLVMWHDKGDDGVRMVERMAELYRAENPGVRVRSLSFPTEQWISRSIAALNTNTAPDLLFNDNSRIVLVQQTTRRLAPMDEAIAALPEADRRHLTASDIAAGSLDGRAYMVPFQRVITGWGVRRSWLEAAGERFPQNWEDTLRIARAFQAREGGGRVFGMAMQGGNAPSFLGAGVDLLVLGSGQPHALINEAAEVVIDRPEVARPTIEYVKLYATYRLVSPETVNHGFTDMYQLIEGGRAGMFRVGNWNVAKWDREPPAGDYVVGPYPGFGQGPGAMFVGSVRGMAVPAAGRNRDAAIRFARFVVSRGAQQASLDHMGGVVRADVDTSNVTPSLRPFLDENVRLQTDDFMASRYAWYPQLREAYYRELIAAVNRPPADWDAWIAATAVKMRAEVARLRRG